MIDPAVVAAGDGQQVFGPAVGPGVGQPVCVAVGAVARLTAHQNCSGRFQSFWWVLLSFDWLVGLSARPGPQTLSLYHRPTGNKIKQKPY